MKKLVIAVLAIGAMAACTKSNIQYEQPEEISFQPVAKKATKAVTGAIDGNAYPTGEDFNVWSWWTGKPAGTLISELANDYEFNEGNTESNNPILYIKEGTFTNRKDADNNPTNTWGGKTTPYYWPTTGSLVFAGYSPAPAEDEASRGTFKYDFKTQTFTVEGYTQSNDISKTVDLMWFDADESYKKNGAVNVTFNHALSWLEFRFNLTAGAPQNWMIYAVTLKGIETIGNFTAKTGASAPKTWLVNPTSTEEFIVAKELTKDLTPESEAYNLTPESEKGVVIIPQSCAINNNNDITLSDAYLEISYGLLTPASAGSANKVYIPQKVTLPLTYTDNSSNEKDAWEPGYHYIYTITFGANEILISPSVTDWTDETENIDVV